MERYGLMPLLMVVSLVLTFTVCTRASEGSCSSTIYDMGKYAVQEFIVAGSDSWWNDLSGLHLPKCETQSPAPYPAGEKPVRTLRVMVPNASGDYPVIHLQHGFMLKTSYYTQLMQHIASHGFIVIAPQMSTGLRELVSFDASNEIASAAAVVNWYPNNLAAAIARAVSENLTITPNLHELALVGHSRGGKVSFALAKGLCKASVQYVAITGLDPVDGVISHRPIPPPVLPYTPQGLNLTIPTLIIGAALGECGIFPCAPVGVNEVQFFEDSAPPALQFVATEYGHMDFLNQKLGLLGELSVSLCKSGSGPEGRKPMRTFSGGMVIAFVQATIFGDRTAINYYLENPQDAPINLDPVNENGWLGDALASSV